VYSATFVALLRHLVSSSGARFPKREVDSRVVLSDVLGSKDVVEGRDGRTDGRTCRIVIGRIHVKTKLHAQICFYVLPLVNTVG
jgi:hypothetical protein